MKHLVNDPGQGKPVGTLWERRHWGRRHWERRLWERRHWGRQWAFLCPLLQLLLLLPISA